MINAANVHTERTSKGWSGGFATGQYRAMPHGNHSVRGILGNGFSASYGQDYSRCGSSPTPGTNIVTELSRPRLCRKSRDIGRNLAGLLTCQAGGSILQVSLAHEVVPVETGTGTLAADGGPEIAKGGRPVYGCRVSFWTLQLLVSATNSSLGLRQSIPCSVSNSLSSLPARPNLPRMRPSSSIL